MQVAGFLFAGRQVSAGRCVSAWLECATGISGDSDSGGIDRRRRMIRRWSAVRFQSLGLPDVRLRLETVIKGGFRSLQAMVDHPEQHAHRHLADIRAIVHRSALTARQQSPWLCKCFR
jgi:uncharacterized protein (DUF111 family)